MGIRSGAGLWSGRGRLSQHPTGTKTDHRGASPPRGSGRGAEVAPSWGTCSFPRVERRVRARRRWTPARPAVPRPQPRRPPLGQPGPPRTARRGPETFRWPKTGTETWTIDTHDNRHRRHGSPRTGRAAHHRTDRWLTQQRNSGSYGAQYAVARAFPARTTSRDVVDIGEQRRQEWWLPTRALTPTSRRISVY